MFKKIIFYILKIYILYLILTSVLLFSIPNKDTDNIININDYYGNESSCDRAFVVEEMDFSAKIKINLIENAKEYINISYYKIQNDTAGDIFFAKILEAADRGVKVRIVLDGKINKIGKDINGLNNLISTHPNVEIRYYEIFNFLKPWAFNNVLHDKYIVVDDKIALLGGRNIGNQYFTIEEITSTTTNDREVLLINTGNIENSAINQINNYFFTIWENQYTTKIKNKEKSDRALNKAIIKRENLNSILSLVEKKYPKLFSQSFNYISLSHPTNKVTLIHNSIDRFKKNPICLQVIASLMNNAKSKITLQSPYIIPTKEMRTYFDLKGLDNKGIDVITNSDYSTPNLLAYAGYLKYRDMILNKNINVYEYQNVGSIHAKSYIIDERLALVGSFNMDSRSAFLSTETMLVIDSPELSYELQTKIDNLKEKSVLVSDINNQEVIKNTSLIKKILLRILKIIVYPFSYLL